MTVNQAWIRQFRLPAIGFEKWYTSATNIEGFDSYNSAVSFILRSILKECHSEQL